MKAFSLFLACLLPFLSFAESDQFFDYETYNHNCCPDCHSCPCICESSAVCVSNDICYVQQACDPCAPVCGTQCGLSVCSMVVAAAAIVGIATVILSAQAH